jgi:HlyD family secretion protein
LPSRPPAERSRRPGPPPLKQLLVPNGALRFQPDTKEKGKANVLNPEIGLEQNEQRATIGAGSRQRVWVLQADGKLKPIDALRHE